MSPLYRFLSRAVLALVSAAAITGAAANRWLPTGHTDRALALLFVGVVYGLLSVIFPDPAHNAHMGGGETGTPSPVSQDVV